MQPRVQLIQTTQCVIVLEVRWWLPFSSRRKMYLAGSCDLCQLDFSYSWSSRATHMKIDGDGDEKTGKRDAVTDTLHKDTCRSEGGASDELSAEVVDNRAKCL